MASTNEKDHITIMELVRLLGTSASAIREFILKQGVPARANRLGEGREKHYDTVKLITAFETQGYTDEASKVKNWMSSK